MAILRSTVLVAVISGLFAGLVLAVLQTFSTVPLILQAETFEHAAPAEPAVHEHAPGTPDHSHDAAPAHDHGDGWAPEDGVERTFYTFASVALGSIGYALLLVVASELGGGITSLRQGIFWGLGGFAAFVLAPGLGLPPELPGMPAGDLVARQIWWIGTAAATAAGLAMIVFRGTLPWVIGGLALLVLPHLIGAPQPADHTTAVPESLHHDFVVASTITNLIFFVVLGATIALVRNRWFAAELNAPQKLADPSLTLLIGGARSGKSAHAEALIGRLTPPWTYVATGQAFDAEMRERIARHQARRGEGWSTIEAPLDLADTLSTVDNGAPVLVDCLTLWLTNHMLAGHDLDREAGRLCAVLASPRGPWFVVSNEVGLGIVPDNALARRFRDEAGRLNQRVATLANRVLFMAAGLPMVMK